MARDAVTVSALTQNALNTNPAGTSISPTNGANIAGPLDSRILVRITNTNGTNRVATFKAGADRPAGRSSLGDLAITVPATTGDVLVPIETARFLQTDGSINVDFGASMAGIISVVRVPKGA